LWDLTHSIRGLLIGDKGYISQPLKEQLAIQEIDLQTPLRSNMQDSRPTGLKIQRVC
jgi:adenylate kinase family enzyme